MTSPKGKLFYETHGDANSSQMLIFIHGFPDNHKLWNDIIPEV